jgi:hypothetical protein
MPSDSESFVQHTTMLDHYTPYREVVSDLNELELMAS